jgi:hypothetical protein
MTVARLFTFPDPNLTLVRRFAPQVIEMTAGPAPLAIIALNATYGIGDELRVQGILTDLDNGSMTVVAGESFNLSASGAFDETISLPGDVSSVSITASTNTTGKFTAFTVDLVEP